MQGTSSAWLRRSVLMGLAGLVVLACTPSRQGGGGQGGSGQGGSGGGAGAGEPDDKGKSFSGEHSDPSAPAGAKDGFSGPASTDPGQKPSFVYPLEGAMLGRNIGGMVLQWRAGSGQTIFRVRVKGDAGSASLFAGSAACPGGKCSLPVPDAFWSMIAKANSGARITLGVDGVAMAGGAVGSSDPLTLHFSPEDLGGGLYYWSTKLPGLMRVKLGDPAPEPFLSQADAGHCIGCHAVTRDGCKVAYIFDGCHAGSLGVVGATDPKTPLVMSGSAQATLPSWNPDGTQLATVYKGELIVRTAAGAEVVRIPRSAVGPAGGDDATHPEWSPDGNTIVFTRQTAGVTTGSTPPMTDCIFGGDIMTISIKGGVPGAAATVLVPGTADEFNYYPHFSPDSKWVVFDTAKRPGKSPFGMPSSYDQKGARLQLVSASGGTPVALMAATQQLDRTASWPKFAPFSMRKGNLMFFVFSSRIDYGWVVEQDGITPESPGLYGRPQLWVAAIDVSRPGDPSYAPFWLPVQVSEQGNHLAYWTTRIVGGTIGGMGCM